MNGVNGMTKTRTKLGIPNQVDSKFLLLLSASFCINSVEMNVNITFKVEISQRVNCIDFAFAVIGIVWTTEITTKEKKINTQKLRALNAF